MINTSTNPDHYSRWKIQPWDFISQNNLDFMRGNVIKYVMRYDAKNGVEDLIKAKDYIDKIISNLTGNPLEDNTVKQIWQLSLYHIIKNDAVILTKNAFNCDTGKGSRYIYRHEAGFFIAVDKDVEYPAGLSSYFENYIKYCLEKGYAWINFDKDADPCAGCPLFVWEEVDVGTVK